MPKINRRGYLRRFLFFTCVALSGLIGGVAVAQEETTFLTPDIDPDGPYLQAVDGRRTVSTDLRYVDETSLDLLTGDRPRAAARPTISPPSGPVFSLGSNGVFIIVALFAVLLFLFLKFGAGGALLRPDPNVEKKPRKRAKAWGLTAAEGSAGDILAQIRAMPSRREALILLLRHCLLQAADETNTNFRRADTEREALGRLPDGWRRYTQLKTILTKAELVHYGGRDIGDDEFEALLQNGAQILTEAR
ncbi:hypothetical protein [Yoonia sediminilitoris]|uniref:DUF4129 domain-containing protein n=1 Tax=Yoonia sediminilitoris TaxID=1286148 RepID=A0A2T6KMN3_9RHOB|nr:hypothetical protein [Yoonia sediminilitoris]PUB17483.1 hypothetical protein C8N45_102495 [Yoonia sediminilitoris]RCW97778.1 hypothetical protein DFP92_102495 [Yoonia sediminilitoris]